jgi:3-methylcrotonyl-CoA carboxylase alpha subunit
MFRKILIANRGEIACRVIRTCRRLGIASVAVHSDPDAAAQHVLRADEAVALGGSTPEQSYLRGDAIIAAALATGAQAIHPGYGFLSENAEFAEAVTAAGLVFIGPSAQSMRRMGSKAGAKALMQAAGIPVVAGYNGPEQDLATLRREAERTGFPLMIKAAHGGGGKGMRVVTDPAGFQAALESCQREARNAFGQDRVLLERYVQAPRHIEIQVFGDQHGRLIHLNERECSAQRRYQKVLEESPSPFLEADLRARMGQAAVAAAQAIDYCNAGTVEFIVDADGSFYFMEINTRLQVEHPVTEMVSGLDLVEWQLRVAAGQPLPLAQDQVRQDGHAIEVRLYAEDPDAGFLPASGPLLALELPAGEAGVRVDTGVAQDDVVSVFYDPMIAKLIVHAGDRQAALARMRQVLASCHVGGLKTNLAFLEALLRHRAVVEGQIDTGYLDRHLDEFLASSSPPGPLPAIAAVALALAQAGREDACNRAGVEPDSPWNLADGWRLAQPAARRLRLQCGSQRWKVQARGHGADWDVEIAGTHHAISMAQWRQGQLRLLVDGRGRQLRCWQDGPDALVLHDGHARHRFHVPTDDGNRRADADASDGRVLAPMPGRVAVLRVAAGDAVEAGQELLVMEAMKMELAIRAPRAGTVAELRTGEGEFVEADTVLLAIRGEPHE